MDLALNISYDILLSKKLLVRNREAIDRVSDIFFNGLKNGLTNKEWQIILQRIDGLSKKIFSFLIVSTKHTDGTIYSTITLNPYENKLKKFEKRLKLWFSLPRKRKHLKDNFWLEEQDKEYLLSLIENAFENGLDEKQKKIMTDLLYPNRFIYFEFAIEKKKVESEIILNYY